MISPLEAALHELELGVRELPGERHHPRILRYFRETQLPVPPRGDETAWCAAFVNFCLMVAGYEGTGSAMAASFDGWGSEVSRLEARPRDIVRLWRGTPTSGFGHVGFWMRDSGSFLWMLGGNQSETHHARRNAGEVSVAAYPVERLVKIVRPSTVPDHDFQRLAS